MSNSNNPKPKAELTSSPLQLPHPVTPPYTLTPSPQLHTNLAPDAVIPTHVAPVQPLTANAVTATALSTEDPAPSGIQLIPPTRGGHPKAENAGSATTDIQAGHITEEGSHAEATPEIEGTSAPVTAHLRTVK